MKLEDLEQSKQLVADRHLEITKQVNEYNAELNRLQGEYRCLERLITSLKDIEFNKENKKNAKDSK